MVDVILDGVYACMVCGSRDVSYAAWANQDPTTGDLTMDEAILEDMDSPPIEGLRLTFCNVCQEHHPLRLV